MKTSRLFGEGGVVSPSLEALIESPLSAEGLGRGGNIKVSAESWTVSEPSADRVEDIFQQVFGGGYSRLF